MSDIPPALSVEKLDQWAGASNGPSAAADSSGPVAGCHDASQNGGDNALAAEFTLPMSPDDDHGDDAGSATPTGVDTANPGVIEVSGDQDWFSFPATGGNSYLFETTLGTLDDSVLYLFDTDGVTEIFVDDDSGVNFGSRIVWTAPADGVYYLKVQGYEPSTGSYVLDISSFSSFDDHGNDAGTATPTGVDTSNPGVIEVSGDQDWFSFPATGGNSYLFETTLGSLSDSMLSLIDTDGTTEIAMDDDGGEGLASRIVWTAPADGVYYLKVEGYESSTGSYVLGISSFSVPDDDHGNDAGSATPTGVDTSNPGVIEVVGDQDWFSFPATSGNSYLLETTLDTLHDSVLHLIDTDGATEIVMDDDSGEGLASRIVWTAPADGTYYLKVRGYGSSTGSYVLDITQGDFAADLTPFQREEWNDIIPIGISQSAGASPHSYSGPYYDDQPLYFNWASFNQGDATAWDYTVHFEVTGTGGGNWDWTGITTDPSYYTYLTDDRLVSPLSAGDHTFRLWVDSTDVVAEGENEGNNYYQRTITVQPAPLGEIRGSKWNDLDGNGVWDDGEPGLADWKIYLDENFNGRWDDGEAFDLTDEHGDYAIADLRTGIYAVAEESQSGWSQTFPGPGHDSAKRAGDVPMVDGPLGPIAPAAAGPTMAPVEVASSTSGDALASRRIADSDKGVADNEEDKNEEYKEEPVMAVDPLPDLQRLKLDESTAMAASFPLEDTFLLHSNPGASKVIYLDFDGHTTTGTIWNVDYGDPIVTPPYSFEGDGSFSTAEQEQIQRIWERVAEDYIPFDVDVTTEDPGKEALINSGGSDTQWGVRVVIGANTWFDDAGGVAYVGSFNWNSDTPCFVFNPTEVGVAEAASHEAGHTVGLLHDGTSAVEYFEGYGSGPTGWAPIMGVGYYRSLVQWSKGEYPDANNTEDDLHIITTDYFGYRADDHGSTPGTASPLDITGGATVFDEGIIERNTDVDYFVFTTGGGPMNLDIDPFYRSPNLDILASLFDASGSLVASSNPTDALDANLNLNLPAGTYYLSVDGVGKPAGTDPGYSDYGSLGYYSITGTIIPVGLPGTHIVQLGLGAVESGINFGNHGQIAGRYVFYNHSHFDGDNAAADAQDIAAIAADKRALLPGRAATFANYTSYDKGINGIMIDIAELPVESLTAADFEFLVGNRNDLANWTVALTPQSIDVSPGIGVGGTDRVTIIWPDDAIENTWLQVTVKSNDNTGLVTPDVFYFGNAIGESGNAAGNAIVNATDEIMARNFPHNALNPATIDDPYDYDRDGLVNGTDQIIARSHQTNPLSMLRLIAAPAVEAGVKRSLVQESAPLKPTAAELNWLYEFQRISTRSARHASPIEAAVDALLATYL